MIEAYFEDFGLGEKEAHVYIALLKNGEMSVGALSKLLQIPRATLYGYLERLKVVGMVGSVQQKSSQIFFAEAPEKLKILYQQRLDMLSFKRADLESKLPQMEKISKGAGKEANLQYFQGEKSLQAMMSDMLSYENGEVLSFWPIQSMVNLVGADYLTYFNVVRIKKNISLKAIWPSTQMVNVTKYPFMASGKAFKRTVRVAPSNVASRLSYMIYADKVMVASSKEESYGFILESKDMADMLKEQFNMLWHLSNPLEHEEKSGKKFLDILKAHGEDWVDMSYD